MEDLSGVAIDEIETERSCGPAETPQDA